MSVIAAVIKKEFLHILRDRRTLMMIVLMPIMQLVIYGYGINTDVKHLSLAVYDEDKTPVSRRLVDAFVQSSYFDARYRVTNHQQLRHTLDRGQAKAGLHIPPNFARDIYAGRSTAVQMVIDGTDSTPANVAQNTSQAIVAAFVRAEGLSPVIVEPVELRARLWYNPDLKSSFFMIPGLIGLLLQILIPMVTATAVVREKERGNIEQLLVTPIKRYELIVGKIVPYLVIGLLIALFIISTANLLFHVPVRGSPVFLFLMTILFLFVCLGFGLFASTVAQNQQQAAQIVMLLMAPSILLSGFIFPREGMPPAIYLLGHFIPLTYFLKIVRGVTLKGLGPADLWDQIIPLVVMAAVILSLSILKFRKRLA